MKASFENAGIVSVRSGIFSIEGSGTVQTHTGIFNHSQGLSFTSIILQGAAIQFAAGTHYLGPSSIVLNGQGISFAGASTIINGTFQPDFFQQVKEIIDRIYNLGFWHYYL